MVFINYTIATFLTKKAHKTILASHVSYLLRWDVKAFGDLLIRPRVWFIMYEIKYLFSVWVCHTSSILCVKFVFDDFVKGCV